MKLIKQKAEIIEYNAKSFDDILKHIEKCGKVCYKSENEIMDDSYYSFFDKILRLKHYSVLEHGTLYLKIPIDNNEWIKYSHNKYSIVNTVNDICYVTTNLRVVIENKWKNYLDYISEQTEHHEPRYTVKFTTNIGVSRELNRHRCHSISEESTRYCNYNKSKFDNQITYIIPSWLDLDEMDLTEYNYTNENKYAVKRKLFLLNCIHSEHYYMRLNAEGCPPQEARSVLNLSTKTESVHTAFGFQWKDFFSQRLFGNTGKAHPDMIQLANLARKEFEQYGHWKEIYENYGEKKL